MKQTTILFLLCAALLAGQARAQRPPNLPGGLASGGFGAGQSATKNQVSIRISGGYRYITANGIPDHQPGRFPNRNNPNSIRPQNHQYRLTLNPRTNATPTWLGLGLFGIALNGVPMEPNAAEFWQRNFNSGWQYEAKDGSINLGLDQHNAHVQPTGKYHYHAMPVGLVQRLDKGGMTLIGYAADGFPVYAGKGFKNPMDPKSPVIAMKPSFRLRTGVRPTGPKGRYDGTFIQDYQYVRGLGHLDECNGRFGVTPEYPKGIYHYFITDTWPYLPRYLRGTVDPSFQRRGPGGGGPPGRRGGPPGGRRGPPGRRPPGF